MNQVNTIIEIAEYRRVHVNLKKIIDEKNITRYALAASLGMRFEVINRWYHDDIAKIDLDVLARICCILDCTPQELITYEKPEKK